MNTTHQHGGGGRRPSSSLSIAELPPLRQVDPSPILTPDVEKADSNAHSPSPVPSTAVGLSGSGHGMVYYLSRIQHWTSYPPLIFSVFHLVNTSIIPLSARSVQVADDYLLLTRPYYQSFPLEHVLLTIPISLHVLSGIAIRLHRRNVALARYGASSLRMGERIKNQVRIWPTVSWISIAGYSLIPMLAGHVWVNRLAPWVFEGGSSSVGLTYVSHGFARWPLWNWCSYLPMVALATGHFVWGLARWRNWLGGDSNKARKRNWWSVHAAWASVASLWLLGGLGVVARAGKSDGWVGKGYDVLYGKTWIER